MPDELPILRALERGETVRSEEMRWELADGRVVLVLVNATPVIGEDGRVTVAIAMVQEARPALIPYFQGALAGGQREGPSNNAPEVAGMAVSSATDAGLKPNNEDAIYCTPDAAASRTGLGWL